MRKNKFQRGYLRHQAGQLGWKGLTCLGIHFFKPLCGSISHRDRTHYLVHVPANHHWFQQEREESISISHVPKTSNLFYFYFSDEEIDA